MVNFPTETRPIQCEEKKIHAYGPPHENNGRRNRNEDYECVALYVEKTTMMTPHVIVHLRTLGDLAPSCRGHVRNSPSWNSVFRRSNIHVCIHGSNLGSGSRHDPTSTKSWANWKVLRPHFV